MKPNCYFINLESEEKNKKIFYKNWDKYFNINKFTAIDKKIIFII